MFWFCFVVFHRLVSKTFIEFPGKAKDEDMQLQNPL